MMKIIIFPIEYILANKFNIYKTISKNIKLDRLFKGKFYIKISQLTLNK